MAASIRLSSGAVATVTDGRWQCPEMPELAAAMNKVDLFFALSDQVAAYIPDVDQELARLAAWLLGGETIPVVEPVRRNSVGLVY